MDSPVPAIEIPRHADPHGRRRPYGKANTLYSIYHAGMCPQLLIDGIMNSVLEFLRILLCDLRLKTICLLAHIPVSICVLHYIMIDRQLIRSGNKRGKIAVLVGQLHRYRLLHPLEDQLRLFRPREIRLNQVLLSCFVGPQKRVRIIAFRINDLLDLWPVHHFIQPVIHSFTSLRAILLIIVPKKTIQNKLPVINYEKRCPGTKKVSPEHMKKR